MKKKWIRDAIYYGIKTKTWKIMRLSAFFLFLFLSQVWAESGYSQQTKLTLKMNNARVIDVLDEIENNSEFYFLVNQKLVDVERKVDVNAKEKTIGKILTDLFVETDVRHQVKDRLIILTTEKTNFSSELVAQQKTITGTVIDESGQTLPGVTVVIKGTTQGTVTDMDGNYSIPSVPDDAILVFSFVGMQTHEIVVGNQTSINITMLVDAIGIEEVVAIGYGTQKKSSVTGAMTGVKADDLADRNVVNLDQALVGQMSGIRIQQSSGVPGSDALITIRGRNSINSNTNPLILIDGVEAPMNSINPSDVASIDVLKDVSSASIYGSRGANGVILITTKTGSLDGKQRISFEASYGIQEAEKMYDLMDKSQWYDYIYRLYDAFYVFKGGDPSIPMDDRGTKYQPHPFIYNTPYDELPDTDWLDLMFNPAPIQNYQFSVSGGIGKTTYFISGRYFNQEGILINTGAERYNFRAKIDSEINNWLKVGVNIAPTIGIEANRGADNKQQTMQNSMLFSPLIPEDSNTEEAGYVINTWGNPYLRQRDKIDEIRWNNIVSNVYVEVSILKGLTFRSSMGMTLYDRNDKYFEESIYVNNNSVGSFNTRKTQTVQVDNTLNFTKDIFTDHHLSLLLGQSAQKNKTWSSAQRSSGYPNDFVYTLNVASIPISSVTSEFEANRTSYFGRIQYDYQNKYLLAINARYDGSSRFGPNSKWGFFPSASIGWKISEESFMQDISWINLLKLRASIGRAGNDGIGDYRWISTLTSANYVYGNEIANGYAEANYANKDLGWEEIQSFNIGLDLWALNNKLQFTVDFYDNKTSDLLISAPLPRQTGFTSTIKNYGEVRNYGIESEISGHILSNDKFKWETSVNISYNNNEVVDIPDPYNVDLWGVYSRMEEGHGIFDFYMYQFDGLVTQEDLDNGYNVPGTLVGGLKYKDLNGDNAITPEDRDWAGSPTPKFIYGWSNTFEFLNFDLTVLLQGQSGGKTFWMMGRQMDNGIPYNQLVRWADNYQSVENPGNGRTPVFYSKKLNHSTYNLYESDFIRLKNVTLGYQIPRKLLDRIKIPSARLFVTGENLSTWFGDKEYPGVTTESATAGRSVNSAVDYTTYPLARTVSLGLKINF